MASPSKQSRPVPFRTIDHPDPKINRIQQNVEEALGPLQRLADIVDDEAFLITTLTEGQSVDIAIDPTTDELLVIRRT